MLKSLLLPLVFVVFLNIQDTTGQNLISNGDFESACAGWTNISTSPGVATYTCPYTADKHGGVNSLRADVTTAGSNTWDNQTLGPSFTTVSGTNYTLTFWARSATAGSMLRIVLQNTTYTATDFTLSTSWTKYSMNFTPTETSLTLKVHYFQTGDFYLDDFEVNNPIVNNNGVSTYVNPVLAGDHPDQTVLKVGNDFYTTGSSFHFTPYVPILHSTDLIHWEVVARVVPPTWSSINTGNDDPAEGIWQGALAYFNNKYWVYFSLNTSGGQYFSTATDIKGPWTAPTKVNGVIGYDNSIFVDDDGKAYMLIKNGQLTNGIQPLGTDGQPTGSYMNMNWVNVNNRYGWAEGPVMCKRNNRYYYFVAGDVTGGQYVLSSPSLTATESSWTLHGSFWNTFTNAGGFSGPNHISAPIQIADGTWWVLSHAYDNNNWQAQGRQGLLHQVLWDNNGVPKGVSPSIDPVTAPDLPSSGISYYTPKTDFFNSSTLGMDWHFLDITNASRYSLSERTGYLRLKPGNDTTHLLQKEAGKFYSIVTKIDFNATANNHEAGIRLMNGADKVFYTLYSGFNGGKKLGIYFNGNRTEVNNSIGNVVWLKAERNQHNIIAYYSTDGNTWTQLGSAVDVSNLDKSQPDFNSWVGTSIGLYSAYANADFDQFIYKDGFSLVRAEGRTNFSNIITSAKTPGNVITNSADGGWFMLAGVSLERDGLIANQVQVNAASAVSGSSLEVWLDNIGSGTKIATLTINSSGGNDSWANYTAGIPTVGGQHDVYIRFIGNANSVFVNTITFMRSTTSAPLAKCKGKYFGNILQYGVPGNYNSLWNQTTSENGSKWGSIEGTKGVYNWTNSDLAYNWAKNNNGLFKFHTFVWGGQTPGWVATASTADIQAGIENYIKAAATHYGPMGGLQLIDVLNEPVNTPMPGNMKGALTAGYQADPANVNDKNNPYGWAIWPFQLARKYFPDAVLLINEFNTEMNWGNCRAPYIAMINAIKNAPNLTNGNKNLIDGVGLQCHGIDNLTAANFKACIDEIWNKTGVPLHISEFDQVANPDEAKQRSVYSALIPIAWEHPHVAGITLWGYIQGSTWVNGNGTAGPGGTDSGIMYANGNDRPAMSWLRTYMASQPDLPCCPSPSPFGSCVATTTNDNTISDKVQGFIAFPNPFSEHIAISRNGRFIYQVFTMDGRELESGEGNEIINIGQSWAPGFYILKLVTSNGHEITKICKTR